jgi:hypothetical protein
MCIPGRILRLLVSAGVVAGVVAVPISPHHLNRKSIQFFGSMPALRASNRSPAVCRRSPSAIWLRAEFPVPRNNTLTFMASSPSVATTHTES